jgi:hypothetical protein
MSKSSASTAMREKAVATPWLEPSREVAEAQRAFAFDLEIRRNERISRLYDMARRWLAKHGGAEALRASMGKADSFISTVSKAFNRVSEDNGQHAVKLDWFAYGDDDADYEFVAGVNDAMGFEPPVRKKKRVVTEDQTGAAARRVIATIKDPDQRELFVKRMAKELGVDAEDVRL